MEKELRNTILDDCKRLLRESKKLRKRSRELVGSGRANKLSEVFGEEKRKSEAASASSRDDIFRAREQ
jgi:hypothetical protein